MVSIVDNFLPQSGAASSSAGTTQSGGLNPTLVSTALNAVDQLAPYDGHISLSALTGETFKKALGLHDQSVTGSTVTDQSAIQLQSLQAVSDTSHSGILNSGIFNNILNLSGADASIVPNNISDFNAGSDIDILAGFIDPNSYLANSGFSVADVGQNIHPQQGLASGFSEHTALLTARAPDSSILIEPLAQLAGNQPVQSHLISPQALTALSDGDAFDFAAITSHGLEGAASSALNSFDGGQIKGPSPAPLNTPSDHANKLSASGSGNIYTDIAGGIPESADPLSVGLTKAGEDIPAGLTVEGATAAATNASSTGRIITNEPRTSSDSSGQTVKADRSPNEDIILAKTSAEQNISQKTGQNNEAQNSLTGNTGNVSPPAEGHAVGSYSAGSKQKLGQSPLNPPHHQELNHPLGQIAKDSRTAAQGKDHFDARLTKEIKAPSLADTQDFHQIDDIDAGVPEEIAYTVRELNTVVLRSRAETQPLPIPSLSLPSASLESLTGFTALSGLDPLGDALFVLPTDMIEASRINLNTPAAIAAGHQAAKGLALAINKNTSAGQDHFSIRLDPPSLGRVTVQLKFSEGQVAADILAERPETLTLLKRDSKILEKALAETGYDLSADDISFTLDDHENSNSENQSTGKLFTEDALNGHKHAKNNGVTDMNFKDNDEVSSENSASDTLTDPLTLEALIGGKSPLLGLDIRV